MTLGLFKEIFVIFIISMFVLYFCSRLKIPAIVGYLFTGAFLGPYGLRLVNATHEVEYLAEVGVVLLLFTIGIEFSFKKLLQIRKALILGGFTQVSLTIAAVTFIAYEIGFDIKPAIFIGFLVSLSSTAIVLKYLQEKAEIDTVYGQTSLAILIFQDIVIVPMILLTPLLAQTASGGGDFSLASLLVKIAGIVFLIIAATKFIVPQILYHVAKTRNQDLFLLTVIVICASVAVLTSKAGLSLALGAFLAGLVISESEYSHQALGHVLPFKSIFTSFFFVSIGMLLNMEFLFSMPFTITALTLSVIAVKSATAFIGGALLNIPSGSAFLAGFALCQIGEFSFVLSKTGMEYKIISIETYQAFLSVAVLTMILTPAVIYLAHIALKSLIKNKYIKMTPEVSDGVGEGEESPYCEFKNQLIIIGYGITGQNLARAAKASKIPYVISDVNPETVRREKASGEPIIYGDATYESVLEHLNIKCAKIIVIAVPDRIAVRRIVGLSRKMNHEIYIIARTRFFSEVEEIKKLGADEVIPEEFETSIEIFARVMQKYLIPQNEIEDFISAIRKGSYEMLRTPNNSAAITDVEFKMPDIRITTFRVAAHNHFADKTLAEIDLRKKYGLTLIGIARGGQNIINPSGSELILENDILIFIGDAKELDKVNAVRA